MEFILTGDTASGAELERLGLVSKVVPADQVLGEAMRLAAKIASMSAPVVAAAKQAVLTGETVLVPAAERRKVQTLTSATAANSRSIASRRRPRAREGSVLLDVQHVRLPGGGEGLSGEAATEV